MNNIVRLDFDMKIPRLGQTGEDPSREDEVGVIIKSKAAIKRPKRFKVLLHNDDYTTMEFVVYVLQNIFSKKLEEAQKIMITIHNEGVGICGIYTFEIAESKVARVISLAKEKGQPLQCSLESE
jgi:ATP-dependent Clp protease adaptor protein ClpS